MDNGVNEVSPLPVVTLDIINVYIFNPNPRQMSIDDFQEQKIYKLIQI